MEDWPPRWRAACVAAGLDDDAALAMVGAVRRWAPEIEPLERLDDLPSLFSWIARHHRAASLRCVSPPQPGLAAFFSACDREHGVEVTTSLLTETLPSDERFDEWRLVMTGGDRFWFQDRSVAPRLRLMVLGFDYDHRFLRDEYPTAGRLVAHTLLTLLDSVAPSPGVPAAPPELSMVPSPLGPHAQALAQALPLFGSAVPGRIAATVAGIPSPELRYAALQLEARGAVCLTTLALHEGVHAWSIETLVVFDAGRATPTDEMKRRWRELKSDPLIDVARRARKKASHVRQKI